MTRSLAEKSIGVDCGVKDCESRHPSMCEVVKVAES